MTSSEPGSGAAERPVAWPARLAWAALGAFLLFWAVFEAVKHGGWTIPMAVLGVLVPDLSFLLGAGSGPREPGRMPARMVGVYNLLHRPLIPVVALVALSFAPTANTTIAAPFTFALAWLGHICVDRVLGYGLRAPDGRPR
ncbi:membrane protein [Streptomyces daqingensis]|uniref:Membrane protein n=1 Tax=Streptomyces daqingensis TaxID=1472640 RepID=A0ABQ2MG76_9ACTN|nr:DUF4260 family protein [Streptomyces daqingensis]GGO51212.1 membrane protein [Streptomyces daqingensis]